MANHHSTRPAFRTFPDARHWPLAALGALALTLGGCGEAGQQSTLQQQLQQAQADLKRAQEGQRAAERELAAFKKTAANTRYVDDGPSLSPDDDEPSPPPGDTTSESNVDAAGNVSATPGDGPVL